MMLVQADSRGKWEVGAHAHEHPTPAFIVEIEIEPIDPALGDFQVRAVVLLSPDCYQNAGWLPRLENHRYTIRFAALKIGPHEVVTPFLSGSLFHLDAP